jgi:hypothetical protein
MSHDNRVTIRLSKEQYFLYEMRAAAKGMRVSTYVKSLLDDRESSSSGQLTELLRLVRNLDEKASLIADALMAEKGETLSRQDGDSADDLSLEMLLMLRAMAKPEQLKMAHARMREKDLPILNLQDY